MYASLGPAKTEHLSDTAVLLFDYMYSLAIGLSIYNL
jgi:hypothetical protein